MIRIIKIKREEDYHLQVRRFLFFLKVPWYLSLTYDKLILEYPLKFKNLKNLGEAVVFSLLPIAYSEASDIELPGDLSIEVETQDRVDEICRLWNKWFSCNRKIKIIANYREIHISQLERDGAQLFSGGVDSMATFKRQRDKLKYLILYNGAGIRLTRPEDFLKVKEYLERFAGLHGKELVAITTNVHHLYSVSWERVLHACVMLGPVLALSGYMDKIYIASSFSGDHGKKLSWGSHPDLDPLIRCNSVETIHEAFELKRVDKIQLLCEEPELLKHLRVCGVNIREKYNCGNCEKCYRTSMILSLLGVNPKDTSFPEQSFLLKNIVDFLSKNKLIGYTKLFWSENLEFLEAINPVNIEGYNKLKTSLKNFLGFFYLDYKNGFSKGFPDAFEYVSKWRRIEMAMHLKPDSLLWAKRLYRLFKKRSYEKTFS